MFQAGGLRTCLIEMGLALALIACSASEGRGAAVQIEHRLSIRLFPDQQRLVGRDDLLIQPAPPAPLAFQLSEKCRIASIRVDGRPAPFTFQNGTLRLAPPMPQAGQPLSLTIAYQGVFDDALPASPANTDNPGYGVSGTISPQGTFLLSDAGWYPRLAHGRASMHLTVTAPKGILAVTAGRSAGHTSDAHHSVSTWIVDRLMEGLSLSAGAYTVQTRQLGEITIATYFTAPNQDLAAAYLEACARYLTKYQALFGKYPFPQFAVVENFFPTGFGFPSYTLLGSTILRLPFILTTSLGHEIAHCWWGNGVLVDASQGNWCEGLTTYVADYLFQEEISQAQAAEYRLQLLRNYATLVTPKNDFAVARFQSRSDPLTQAIGYGKTAMIFHMLRRKIGDRAFWQALRDLYRHRLFTPTTWHDLQTAFEHQAGSSLGLFFEQWVQRSGAARFYLDKVQRVGHSEGYTVSGRIIQEAPFFLLSVPLVLEWGQGQTARQIEMVGRYADFSLSCPKLPQRLCLDPQADVFRRLYPSEIPVTINTLKAADRLVLVMPDQPSAELAASADLLKRSMGHDQSLTVTQGHLDEVDWRDCDLIFMGLPRRRALLAGMAGRAAVESGSFTLNGQRHSSPHDVLFIVFAHPRTQGRAAALFFGLSPGALQAVARKITHYGKYSYLVFHKADNQDKGTWPVTESPLIYRWPKEKAQ